MATAKLEKDKQEVVSAEKAKALATKEKKKAADSVTKKAVGDKKKAVKDALT